MPDEVAVFIDFENVRYGMLNDYGQEPSFQPLVEKAKKYGRPSVMRAYADFSEHPPELTRQLQICGIEAISVPVKRTIYTKGGTSLERVKNAADMVLALDAMVEAVEADRAEKQKVFLLVTGDRDYVKLVTLLSNRFGQRVIICGVPGSVARDLVTAAGEADPMEVEQLAPAEKDELKRAIVTMVRKGPSPLAYWTVKIVDQWAQDPRSGVPGKAKERRDAIGELLDERVLIRRERDDTKRGRTTEAALDEDRARELGYLSPETE